jgi:hypothetical protein
MRWLYALVAGAVVSGFAFLLLTGRYINDGPVVVTVTRNHGVHEGDLFVISGWAVSMVALLVLALPPGRRGASERACRGVPGAGSGDVAAAAEHLHGRSDRTGPARSRTGTDRRGAASDIRRTVSDPPPTVRP